MVEYRIFETEQFQKDLGRIGRSGAPVVIEKLRAFVYPQLRANPMMGSNIKRLKGDLSGFWRYRIGAWRFFYQIDEQTRIVSMIASAHRSVAY